MPPLVTESRQILKNAGTVAAHEPCEFQEYRFTGVASLGRKSRKELAIGEFFWTKIAKYRKNAPPNLTPIGLQVRSIQFRASKNSQTTES